MTRPIIHLKKPQVAALLSPSRAAPVAAPAPAPEPILTFEEEAEQRALQRTRALIAAIEAHAGLPPETLGRALLLPHRYDPECEAHAVMPTAAIQLWLEGRAGEAAFSEAEERQVIARARERYGFADPAFVRVKQSKPANGHAEPKAKPDLGTRQERWQRLADEMRRSNLPQRIIEALGSIRPVSRQELAQFVQGGRLDALQLSHAHETDLRGWLRLPQGKRHGKRRSRSRNRQVNDFAKAAQAWAREAAKAGAA